MAEDRLRAAELGEELAEKLEAGAEEASTEERAAG